MHMRGRELPTLRETHDKHHVDGDETQQVSHNHAVNHDDERPNLLEASLMNFNVFNNINECF